MIQNDPRFQLIENIENSLSQYESTAARYSDEYEQ